ncbi:MAG: alpha/beta hydrolase [Gammaproteobacteria bacterium]|nr:alpha/beta hydrolase [Gammaproteobacteria bacterium]
MLEKTLLSIPGDHPFVFEGKVGILEGRVMVPQSCDGAHIAMLGHPHPLHGGTMSNKVVTTLARALSEVGIISVRFNFRGVGQSVGQHAHGVGESEDMLILMNEMQQLLPMTKWILAGFSFGSYVVYRAALVQPPLLLFMVAPPVERCDYTEALSCPWVIAQGERDEVVDAEGVFEFAATRVPPIRVMRFTDTGHFFHGKLLLLREQLVALLQEEGLGL